MKEKLKNLKRFNWRLFASLCALALIPAIYQTVRTFIISSNTESGVFDIIGQMEWFDLIDETLRAFLIIAFLLGLLCLNKLFGVTKNFQAERTKLKTLSGLLIFNQLAIMAFVWILYFLSKDYFRAFAVMVAILSAVQTLVFAAVPLAKLDMKMKYYLQKKSGDQTDNTDK